MYKSSGRILEGARVGYESNEAKVTIIANDVGAVGVPSPQRSLMNPVGERSHRVVSDVSANHPETVGTITPQLLDQAKLPVQIPLHRFTRVVGAFVGAAVTVGARHA